MYMLGYFRSPLHGPFVRSAAMPFSCSTSNFKTTCFAQKLSCCRGFSKCLVPCDYPASHGFREESSRAHRPRTEGPRRACPGYSLAAAVPIRAFLGQFECRLLERSFLSGISWLERFGLARNQMI